MLIQPEGKSVYACSSCAMCVTKGMHNMLYAQHIMCTCYMRSMHDSLAPEHETLMTATVFEHGLIHSNCATMGLAVPSPPSRLTFNYATQEALHQLAGFDTFPMLVLSVSGAL